jgi:hypothetical protein
VKPAKNNINISGTGWQTCGYVKVGLAAYLDGSEEVVVGLPLIFKGQPAVGHVIEILEPLKVGDRHTASVDVHVGDDQHALVLH